MRAFKYRLYPSKKLIRILDGHLVQAQRLYNTLLDVQKTAYQFDGRFFDKYELIGATKEFESDLYAQVKQNVANRLSKALKRFFENKRTTGFPRFKPIQRYTSFTYPQHGFKLDGTYLVLGKIGRVKVKLHRPLQGKVKTCTVKKDAGKYFVIFFAENTVNKVKRTDGKRIGIDLGCTNVLNLSNGKKVANPKFLKRSMAILSALQSQKDHTKKGKKKNRLARKITRLHSKVKNQREDFLHKQSRKIAEKYQYICIENIPTQKLVEKKDQYKTVRKSILDAGWSSFLQKLAYKVEETGSELILVDPAYTSQTCLCGLRKKKKLSERVHKCRCGLVMDRDILAAKNILRLGMQSLAVKPRSSAI